MTSVLVTRPLGTADSLMAALVARGYRVHAVPTVATLPVPVAGETMAGFDWIVVTSAAGVAALPSLPQGSRWAAVGRATAAALQARGVTAEVVPETSSGTAIADAIPDPAARRILLARTDVAAPDLPDRLRELGADVVEMTVYRTLEAPAGSAESLAEALADPELGAVVFASGSAVRGFVGLGGNPRLPAVTIGPRTTAVARGMGFEVLEEAVEQTIRALVDAVIRALPVEGESDA